MSMPGFDFSTDSTNHYITQFPVVTNKKNIELIHDKKSSIDSNFLTSVKPTTSFTEFKNRIQKLENINSTFNNDQSKEIENKIR